MASNRNLGPVEFCERKREELRQTVRPPRLLGGNDLVITSYSIHYTKLYENKGRHITARWAWGIK